MAIVIYPLSFPWPLTRNTLQPRAAEDVLKKWVGEAFGELPFFLMVTIQSNRWRLAEGFRQPSLRSGRLILLGLQSDINYPIKTGQGLEYLWSAFQFMQATFQGGLDRVHRVVIVVAERLAPHFPPDPFLRVALRTVRGAASPA